MQYNLKEIMKDMTEEEKKKMLSEMVKKHHREHHEEYKAYQANYRKKNRERLSMNDHKRYRQKNPKVKHASKYDLLEKKSKTPLEQLFKNPSQAVHAKWLIENKKSR